MAHKAITHYRVLKACEEEADPDSAYLRHVSDALSQLAMKVVSVVEFFDRGQMKLQSLHVALMMLDLLQGKKGLTLERRAVLRMLDLLQLKKERHDVLMTLALLQ